MNTVFKPDPLPQRPVKQVTQGKHLTLWEPVARYRIGNYTVVDRLMLRLKKSEIDKAAEAVTMIMSQMIMGTLGDCVVTPEDGEFFTITWPTDLSSAHGDIPPFIYQFLKEYALISPEHKTEARDIREWIRNNCPLPFLYVRS